MILLSSWLVAAALAAPPDWVQTFTVSATAGPPSGGCSDKVEVEAPVAEAEVAPPVVVEPPPSTDAMLPFDPAPGAPNPDIPPELRAALHLGEPFDLQTIPLEPLRGNPSDIAKVRAVLSEAVRGRRLVRIAAWGASHVAGEFFTGQIRRSLQERGGDAGHGFLMPAAPWKGYRRSDVNLCTKGTWLSDFVDRKGGRDDGLLGPFGISVEASTPESSAWIQTTTSNPQGRKVSRFEVYYLRQPGGGQLDLVVDDAPALRVATGADTVGPGAAVVNVPDGPHRLVVSPVGDGPVRILGARMERDGPGVIVDAAGVVGRTASSWLKWDEPLQKAYLDLHPVDLAILAYGTNEANDGKLTPESYRDQLRTVLTRMRAVLPDSACVLVGPSDRGKKVSKDRYVIWSRTEFVAAVQREVGPEFGCATWDMQAASGGPGSVFRWREVQPPLMASDLIHFSAEGYREMARRFLAAASGVGE